MKLSFDLEVSRKTNFPTELNLDEVYIDYSPLSTSISSGVWGGNQNMRILIPKGTPIFIAMKGFSNHSNEKEVILPPGSIIKPFRETMLENSKQKWTECIVMGNIFNFIQGEIETINIEKKIYGR